MTREELIQNLQDPTVKNKKDLVIEYLSTQVKRELRILLQDFYKEIVTDQLKEILDEVYEEIKSELSETLKEKNWKLIEDTLYIVTPSKRKFNLTVYKKLLANYLARELQTRFTLKRYHFVSVFRVSIHNTRCPICSQYEGQLYIENEEARAKFVNAIDKRPPYHPYCRHSLVPTNIPI